VPELRRRHSGDRVPTVLPVRNHPWPSHCWQPPVAADILPASRGRSGKSSRLWANRSSRRRSPRLAAHLPAGASSCSRTFDRATFQASPDELPAIDIHSL
jgi:hypothetical protein